MAIDKKVNTRFTAKDGITKRFGVMARAAARFGRNAASSFRRVNRQASKFRGITSGFLKAQVIGKGFGLLTRGISSVVTSFIAFDKAALGATVRFKDIGPNAANFNEKLKEIEATARRVGSETEFTATQAAEGLDFLARAGFTAAEAMAALGSMVNLATATGEDFNSVADKSSDLLGAFGLNADNTAKKIENLNRLNDVLVKTANSTNVTIETMFDTMKRAAPVGRIVGASLEEVAAMVGILGNVGIKGTEAGTALTNMFLRLSAVTPATKKMLEDIRVEIDDGTGNMKKFSVLMKEISGATAEFGNIKVAKVLDTLFGKRAIAGAKNIGASIKELEDLEKALLNAGMTSQQTADVMRTSIEAKLLALGSAATEFGFKILNAFRTNGKAGIDALTEAVRDFDVKPVIEDLKIVLEVVKAIFKFAGLIAKAFFVVADTIAHSAANISLFDPNISIGENFEFGEDFEDYQPNKRIENTKAQAQQAVKVGGTINVNAPAGTTAESEGPVGFNLQALGAN